ncbi:hypothetical protein KAR91_25940 [Candidatus Pacearchaeota archaeon]|nr:hypothetical protein [Candidatus Pacearchaeota archaeon]
MDDKGAFRIKGTPDWCVKAIRVQAWKTVRGFYYHPGDRCPLRRNQSLSIALRKLLDATADDAPDIGHEQMVILRSELEQTWKENG